MTKEELSAPLIQKSRADALDSSRVEQVALTVPTPDDSSVLALTFHAWALGAVTCTVLSFLNQFFWYRREPPTISSVSAQIVAVPLGHLMAGVVTRRVFFRGRKSEFTLNPGPFNVKGHAFVTIFANSGAGNVYTPSIL